MIFEIEIEQEEDGRWIAEIPDLPGVMQYGQTAEQATAKAQALALFAFHDGEEIGSRMLARISKKTGLKPDDL